MAGAEEDKKMPLLEHLVELRKRLLAAFKEHGIEIPRPQRVVLARESGGGPPTDESLAEALNGE